MAMARETSVIATLYERAIGSEKASMPMKCIDQMPQPMATAPPPSQSRPDDPVIRATREDNRSAVWETNTATATDRSTNQ